MKIHEKSAIVRLIKEKSEYVYTSHRQSEMAAGKFSCENISGKSFSCINIGVGLAKAGKRVLLVDFDPQASMTIALGYPQPDHIPMTVTDLMTKIIEDEPIQRGEGIIHHKEGIDLLPAYIQLCRCCIGMFRR